jgi:hypothetical protein
MSTVSESAQYENLVEIDTGASEAKVEKPEIPASDYPFILKVHCWSRGDADLFAKTINRSLTSKNKSFIYASETGETDGAHGFHDLRTNPYRKNQSNQTRLQTEIWTDTLEFVNNSWVPYFTFLVCFEKETDHVHFARKVKQRLSPNRPFMSFPERKERKWKYKWVSQWDDPNPVYPVYIISKGRADSRLTSRCFERNNIPYYIAVEPQDYDEYACVIDPQKILVLPFSNHGDGPGRARNWCWDHSKANGFKRHWVCDDNITDFYRLYRNRKYPVADGGIFRVAEEFVDRFENVPVAGFNYDFFVVNNGPYTPFITNTRIYSVLLIDNDCPYRWRGRYNEDTILSLDVLKSGQCTIQFNAFLQGKVNTQVLGGGNTAEFYEKEGTYKKSAMLESAHPDVSKVVWRFGRYHHHVDYRQFSSNKLKYVPDYDPRHNADETEKFIMKRVKV